MNRKIALSLAPLLLLALPSAYAAQNIVGQASIIDGDTIEIHGQRIRLWGIDAPESSQLCRNNNSDLYRCGAEAANKLSVFTTGKIVNCTPVDRDRYGRTVARCSVNGIDMAEWLVGNGLAQIGPDTHMAGIAPLKTALVMEKRASGLRRGHRHGNIELALTVVVAP
jgi:endonuclease YncB( thermonuclease family)